MTRAEDLARQFEAANSDFIAAIEGLSEENWNRTTNQEGWTVAALAHHVASSHAGLADMAGAIATEQPLPPFTLEMVNEGNAQAAREHANAVKAEVLAMARDGGRAAAETLRSLDDASLDNSADLFGNPITAEGFAQGVVIGHVTGHLQSLRESL